MADVGSVFVSHKSTDASIGKIIADFLREESGNRVSVFFSSDPQFKSPRGGRTLDDELTEAIGESGVLVLVYTGMSRHVDWSYCIYEAAYAKSKNIPVYIFQCREDAPAPLKHLVRISVSNEADIRKFVIDFLTASDFFPNQAEPVTNFSAADPAIQTKSEDLFSELKKEVQNLDKGPREWTPWPYLRIKVDADDVALIRDASAEERRQRVGDCLSKRAVVVDSKAVDRVFGVGIDDGDPFSRLLDSWKGTHPDWSTAWYEGLVDQVTACAGRSFKPLKDERIREAMTDIDRLPIVTRTLTYSTAPIELDVLFFEVAARSPLVGEVMIKIRDMYHRILDGGLGEDSTVRAIFEEMKRQQRYRLPVLDQDKKIAYMIHRSMISDFISQCALSGKSVDDLHFRDMLGDDEMKRMFETTFVFVKPTQSVAEAREELMSNPAARDIFVTESGDENDPVLGMLTTTDMVEKI